MRKFEEELTFILGAFKAGELDYAETTLKIETLVVNCLGFGLYHATEALKYTQEMNKALTSVLGTPNMSMDEQAEEAGRRG